MNMLLKSRLIKFAKENGIISSDQNDPSDVDLPFIFEYYTVYHYFNKYINGSIKKTEQCLIPGDDGGIDGFVIAINGEIIDDPADIEGQLNEGSENLVHVGFLQAKTSDKYDTKEIARFLDAIIRLTKAAGNNDFSTLEPSLQSKTQVLQAIIQNIDRFRTSKIPCDVFFATLSKNEFSSSGLQLIETAKKKSRNVTQVLRCYEDLNGMEVYDLKSFKIVGQQSLDKRIEELKGNHSAKFRLEHPVEIPPTGNIEGALMGIIPVSELRKIILDDNGELRENIFDGNVRLYQGKDNPVNQAIRDTLKSDDREMFPFLNNGLTIVTRKLDRPMGNIYMQGYQVVNGCQTSNQIAEWLQSTTEADKDLIQNQSAEVLVPIKIIQTDDAKASRAITVATNSQTAITQVDIQGNTSLAVYVK